MTDLFTQELNVANVGLPNFADNIHAAGGSAVQLAWRPPFGGDAAAGMRLARLLDDERIEAANATALARFLAAAAVCVAYVSAVYAAAVVLTAATGGYWPDNPLFGGMSLAAAVVVVVALALLGTTVLSSTANGIAIFMVFGAGLASGLIGQIGSALNSSALERISSICSWALPFEAIYQNGLHALTADVRGATGVIVQLGPFGGAQDAGPLLYPYVLVYLVVVGVLADRIFRRADL